MLSAAFVFIVLWRRPTSRSVTVDSEQLRRFLSGLPAASHSRRRHIFVNVAGDNLAVGDKLILDVTAGSAPVDP